MPGPRTRLRLLPGCATGDTAAAGWCARPFVRLGRACIKVGCGIATSSYPQGSNDRFIRANGRDTRRRSPRGTRQSGCPDRGGHRRLPLGVPLRPTRRGPSAGVVAAHPERPGPQETPRQGPRAVRGNLDGGGLSAARPHAGPGRGSGPPAARTRRARRLPVRVAERGRRLPGPRAQLRRRHRPARLPAFRSGDGGVHRRPRPRVRRPGRRRGAQAAHQGRPLLAESGRLRRLARRADPRGGLPGGRRPRRLLMARRPPAQGPRGRSVPSGVPRHGLGSHGTGRGAGVHGGLGGDLPVEGACAASS